MRGVRRRIAGRSTNACLLMGHASLRLMDANPRRPSDEYDARASVADTDRQV